MCYMCHNTGMRTAGIREARQNLTSLLDDVRKGRQVVISDRGRPWRCWCPSNRMKDSLI